MAKGISSLAQSGQSYGALGMQLALTVVVFSGAGYFADVWLNTSPWLLLVGIVLGMVAMFTQLIRVARDANARREERLAREARTPREKGA